MTAMLAPLDLSVQRIPTWPGLVTNRSAQAAEGGQNLGDLGAELSRYVGAGVGEDGELEAVLLGRGQ